MDTVKETRKGGQEMKDWTQIAETELAFWFKNSAGEIMSVPKA